MQGSSGIMAGLDTGPTPLEIGTIGIAVYAACISTAALLSQRRCKLVVSSVESHLSGELAYQLRVTNAGSRPITVVEYFWRTGRPDGGGGSTRALPTPTYPSAFTSSRLPTFLAEGDVAEYYLDLARMLHTAAWDSGYIVVRDARGRTWPAPFDEAFYSDARRLVTSAALPVIPPPRASSYRA